ncbi:PucR family transcriptional regulator [Leucobacter luti]|uniref:Purine catabolism regulator n=1 Tax=Leucobacter luti TaxID=340320 RepID=A0A4Q7U5P3_9MICO|nr:PucR family transcriptional regulator [Leucobacter luti]MBL3701055.1 PucR family transcriptional regulator [Leucobacter luti]RZT68723.1 purine catabolism regulator [Leucobacter luti]
MAPTLADLLADPALDLSCATGHALLHRRVAHVHVAEVSDPSPWLAKDVLLLTTGLIDRSPAELDAFFAALAARGIAAVGFGVGLFVEDVPPAWIRAADAHEIPLLSIPLATPYIAVSEFVSQRLADRQLDQVRRMLDVQQRLAYSNATPDQQLRALEQLAEQLEATVFWIAAEGIRYTEHGGGELSQAELRALTDELSRHMASGRASGAAAIGGLFVHLASTAGSPLAVARRRRYTPLEQGLIGSLATFIDLSRDTAALPGLAASLREQLITEAITGRMSADPRLFETLFPGTALCTVAFLGPAPHAGAARREPAAGLLLKSFLAAELAAGAPAATPLLSTVDDGFVLVLPALRDVPTAEAIERFLRAETGALGAWRAGVSSTGTPGGVLALSAEARRAQQATAGRPELRVLRAAELERADLLTAWLADSGEAPVFEVWRARLAELDPATGSRLLAAVHAFLLANGGLERASEALGVHRQTLNTRLRDAERELGVSLTDPTERALLWLAFETGALPTQPAA